MAMTLPPSIGAFALRYAVSRMKPLDWSLFNFCDAGAIEILNGAYECPEDNEGAAVAAFGRGRGFIDCLMVERFVMEQNGVAIVNGRVRFEFVRARAKLFLLG